MAKPLLNFYPYVLCEVNSTLVCVNYLCLSPSEKRFLDYIIWYDQIWSIYFQRFDLLVGYFFQFQIIFKSSKMVNFIKPFKNEEELKGMEVASFDEFDHMSIVAILSNTTEHYYLFWHYFFLWTTEKIINQSYIPKYPINYQNKRSYNSMFVGLNHDLYQNQRLKIALLGKKL